MPYISMKSMGKAKGMDIYRAAKEAGYKARDILDTLANHGIAAVEAKLSRELSDDERDEYIEGFWNGVI